MSYFAEEQAANFTPPRKSNCYAITLDTTARAYDISTLAANGIVPDEDRRFEVYITVQAETADLYVYFHTATDSALDRTAAVAAGSATAAYVATHCAYIPAGQERSYRIDRSIDKFLIVQGSAAGKCRVWFSSHPGA